MVLAPAVPATMTALMAAIAVVSPNASLVITAGVHMLVQFLRIEFPESQVCTARRTVFFSGNTNTIEAGTGGSTIDGSSGRRRQHPWEQH